MWWTCIESTCIHDGLGFWVSNMHPEYGLSCLSYELCQLLWWTSVECIHVFMIVRWACLNLMMPAEDLACILVTYHLCRRFESCVCHVRILFRVVSSPSAHVMGLQRISMYSWWIGSSGLTYPQHGLSCLSSEFYHLLWWTSIEYIYNYIHICIHDQSLSSWRTGVGLDMVVWLLYSVLIVVHVQTTSFSSEIDCF